MGTGNYGADILSQTGSATLPGPEASQPVLRGEPLQGPVLNL